MVLHGEALETLRTMESNSVDSVVTDPPYGLAFMGKKWDYDVPSIELWREVLRVLKPGGHLLSFGGTRTYHRMVVAIEDAGFEIRDQLQWLYGSGFPKSMDISKAIDKAAGAKREVLGVAGKSGSKRNAMAGDFQGGEYHTTAPATDEAKQWEGFGTALKPANEPIVLARKPLSEKTVAKNVLRWGVGGLNIAGTRIDLQNGETTHGSGASQSSKAVTGFGDMKEKRVGVPNIKSSQGRFPSNVLLDETAAEVLDQMTGDLGKSSGGQSGVKGKGRDIYQFGSADKQNQKGCGFGDSGGASRFFYVAKASKRERGEGNSHPTVKPIKLMQYLCRLITPPGGTVLDPFMGSGTTGCAAKREGFKFIGVELDPEYHAIAEKRIEASV